MLVLCFETTQFTWARSSRVQFFSRYWNCWNRFTTKRELCKNSSLACRTPIGTLVEEKKKIIPISQGCHPASQRDLQNLFLIRQLKNSRRKDSRTYNTLDQGSKNLKSTRKFGEWNSRVVRDIPDAFRIILA